MLIAGFGRPRVLGPTELQALISRACPCRLDRSPLLSAEFHRNPPLCNEAPPQTADAQTIHTPARLVGLRRSLVRSDAAASCLAQECQRHCASAATPVLG